MEYVHYKVGYIPKMIIFENGQRNNIRSQTI